VVCRFVPQRRLAALERLTGLSSTEIHRRVWASGLEEACERGDFPADEAAVRIAAALGRPLTLDELATTWALAFEPDLDVLEIARTRRPRDPIGLLTNNGPLLLHALPTALPEIARGFDPLLFSCRLRALKPTPALFTAVLREVRRDPGEVLLIDDSVVNVEGARAAGLRALLYTNPAALRRELSARADA
jgi:HAD superfamily hydrolase (TIGR01509 family)